MISLDFLEQVNSGSLQLIAADARRHGRAGGVEVSIEKSLGKIPHREPCDRQMAERECAVAHDRDARMQLVGLPPQREKLFARASTVSRLGKPPVAQRQ